MKERVGYYVKFDKGKRFLTIDMMYSCLVERTVNVRHTETFVY